MSLNVNAIRERLGAKTMPLRSDEPRPDANRMREVLWKAMALAKPPSEDGEWVMRRANDYWTGPGREWGEVHEYAAALDYIRTKGRL